MTRFHETRGVDRATEHYPTLPHAEVLKQAELAEVVLRPSARSYPFGLARLGAELGPETLR